jgi:hypothetical protein
LDRFERATEPFHHYDVSGALRELETTLRTAGGSVPPELAAELIAFDLVPDYTHEETGWGTYYGPMLVTQGREYPSRAWITTDVVNHWVSRARQARHPLLRVRYADAAWDLWPKGGAGRCPPDVPRVMIDAAIAVVEPSIGACDVESIQLLRRALSVAVSLRDGTRVEQVRDAIMALEDRIGVDHLPGLWGFSFDMLLDAPRVPLTDEHIGKIISDLEARLARLSGVTDTDQLEPYHIEGAALRLARHYRKQQQDADVRRVLVSYAAAYLKKAEGAKALVASSWLRQVYEKLLSFNLREEAEAVLLHYREVAKRTSDELHPITASVTIEQEQVEAFLNEMTGGEWEEVLFRIAGHYLPRREEEQQRLEEMMRGRLLGLVSQTVLGHDGRAVAGVGPLDADPEGNLVRHVAQMMNFVTWSIRAVVERLTAARGLSVENVTAFLYQSPIFDPRKRPIVETGLRAYLSGDWLVAIHLLVPQIEDTVRRLVAATNGPTMKKGRNDGVLLRNLDELLRDEGAEQVLGADATFYLRVLLTDQRGWNVRNDVAHGITPLKQFTTAPADRLFHALLLLGSLRPKPPESSEGGVTGVGCHEEPATPPGPSPE